MPRFPLLVPILLTGLLIAAPGCAAERRGELPVQVTSASLDADADGQPEDLRVEVTLRGVPPGRYRARVSLGSPPVAGRDSPHSEHRSLAIDPHVTVGRSGHSATTWYFRAADVAVLASAGPHRMRVELTSEPRTSATPLVFESRLSIADHSSFSSGTPQILSVTGPSADGPSFAVVQMQLAQGDSLVVQASLVAPTFAVQTGSVEQRFVAGRHTLRVPMVDTPEASGSGERRGLRLVVEVIRARNAQVVAMWDSGAP